MNKQAIFLAHVASLAACLFGCGAYAKSVAPECRYSLADAPPNAPQFTNWLVPAWRVRPSPLLLAHNREARRHRTMLHTAAEGGPNFAGHFRVAVWGCGSSCTDWGLIDLATGKVTFDESLRAISGVHVEDNVEAPLNEYWGLKFRRDSALLVVLGAPREDESQEGIRYYRWTGHRFQLLRFIGRAEICGAQSH